MDKTNGFDTEENPMTTILVTGASGFIGSRVVKKCSLTPLLPKAR
jgi:FlaA1/EpsC-like NDP-sugar epimerase